MVHVGKCKEECPDAMSTLAELPAGRFLVLILDNEVTVGEFVARPPLAWTRLTERGGVYRTADGYPSLLTAEQAKFEMRNWDAVAPPAIARALADLDDPVDYALLGNNAGQGLPLAESLGRKFIADRAAIIYGRSLPEIKEYEKIGYRSFFRRSDALARLEPLAARAGRPLALLFINTIQHNASNYHDP